MQTTTEMQKLVNRLWTVNDLARRVQRTPMTIHIWRQRGLPAVVIKGKGNTRPTIRFVPDDARAWARAQGIKLAS